VSERERERVWEREWVRERERDREGEREWVRESEWVSEGVSFFASLSKLIIFIVKLWGTLTNQRTIYLHVTCINIFGTFRNFAMWKQTAPRINSNIVIIVIPVSEQSNRSTAVKTPKTHTHTHTHTGSELSSALTVCSMVFQVVWVRWSSSRSSSASPFSTVETSQSSRWNTSTMHLFSWFTGESHEWLRIISTAQKMLDYLKEKRDVGFFKSLSGLMQSCRWSSSLSLVLYNSMHAFTCTSNYMFNSIFRFQSFSECDVCTCMGIFLWM